MIFIDTGAFVARFLQRDQHHATAREFWNHLGISDRRCFTSNFVIDEAVTLIGGRAGYAFAAERARLIYASSALTILRPVSSDEVAAVGLFEKLADQKCSFTDCVSFVLMTAHGIKTAFTFDRHFQMAGFQVEPGGSMPVM